MSLTPAQLTTLKADIQGNTDPTVVQALADGNIGGVANWYNQDASPDYWIFRRDVEANEVRDVIDVQDMADITDTDRSRAIDILAIRAETGFSGENARDRSAFDDVFSAAAGDNSQQAINALWTRLATNGEKVFKLDTGTGATAGAADTTDWQGNLSVSDINNALNS